VAFAQGTAADSRANPFKQFDEASALALRRGLEGIKLEINKLLNRSVKDAGTYLVIAELMKRVGDSRAEQYYQKTIAAANTEPAYELFYADYLRNFRGPNQPLFPAAEEHYLRARRKLSKIDRPSVWDLETSRRVERGLVALYQEDGAPIINLHRDEAASRPLLLFSSINRFAQLTGDFDNIDDVRGFTSEALLASSRLHQDLSDDVLQRMIRVKPQVETLNRFRFRYKTLPAVDISYKYRQIERGQITNFFEPNKFNRIYLNEFGFSIEKPLAVSRYFDLALRGSYKRARRQGLIEFLPRSEEDINQYEGRAAVSRFLGPDKAIFETIYVFQDIDQLVSTPIKRNRQIVGAKFTYQLLRFSIDSAYRKRFTTRGIHFLAGVLDDKERFGEARLVKNDYFVGASLKGLGGFELTIQPTIFTSRVDGVLNQLSNSQYRTNLAFAWRIKDEENEPGLPEKLHWLNPAFIHLVVPFKHDVALKGLDKFENYDLGIALNAKFFRTGSQRTTFLMSGGYHYQRYYKLNRNLNLLSFNISIGF
jgi:hypothetical protein